MTPEQSFWNYIRPQLLGHVVRVENTLERGMPDVNICYEGLELWIELKASVSHEQVKIRKEQRVWAIRRNMEGGKIYVLSLDETGVISLWDWSLGVETETVDETYQRIITYPHVFVEKKNFSQVITHIYAKKL